MSEQPEGPVMRVSKKVSVPRADEPEKVAYEFACEDGEVTIRRVSTTNKVRASLEDVQKAVQMLG